MTKFAEIFARGGITGDLTCNYVPWGDFSRIAAQKPWSVGGYGPASRLDIERAVRPEISLTGGIRY